MVLAAVRLPLGKTWLPLKKGSPVTLSLPDDTVVISDTANFPKKKKKFSKEHLKLLTHSDNHFFYF